MFAMLGSFIKLDMSGIPPPRPKFSAIDRNCGLFMMPPRASGLLMRFWAMFANMGLFIMEPRSGIPPPPPPPPSMLASPAVMGRSAKHSGGSADVRSAAVPGQEEME